MSATCGRSEAVSEGTESAACPDAGFEIIGRDQVHADAEDGLKVGLGPAQPEQAQPRRQVRQQVYVTVGTVLAAGHAAEYAQILNPMHRRRRDQIMPVAAHPAAHRS
jgi:hypothetical protein